MSKIRIVTDSTVDLTDEELSQYDIEVVPLSIHINGETYIDRVDISPIEFIKKMKEAPELPKSSQPAVGTFVEVYDRLHDEGYEVISIHMTGGMSGTVQSAGSAAKMTNATVTVIDSKYISAALAFQVIEAAKLAKAGKSREEIVAEVDKVREQTTLFVVVDTLENLIKGGRIGKGKGMIGSLLNIKPIASLDGGVYTPVAKVRSHSQVVKYLAKQFVEQSTGKKILGVSIVHVEGLDLANKLKAAIIEQTGFSEIDIRYTTPVIGTHTGVGAIGFMYYLE
ncbi:DegV family protein [Bacillus sp. DNRA2]|uniref:DegV family protein n=1 Tax=Bacillus sp. DNRA2 TaxID=2723053 RepID=UPI00145E5626|nr:DegV family protein [Bacillus sp. DNRA2]NMD72267.1 DegV family protein [Bacillus sp. DNRA2]